MIVKCPKCFSTNVSLISNTHYLCNNPNCKHNGNKTQFRVVYDNTINFPYNQIFTDRTADEFYREPYLEVDSFTLNS